jgi:dimeric dUTPase (all-alpha-NTP-PPase superfamily)
MTTEISACKMQTLFQMQYDLNARCGVIADEIIQSEESITQWVLNYIRAYQQEVAELQESMPWKWWEVKPAFDPQNAKVEIIDLFHFVISLAEVANITPEKIAHSTLGVYPESTDFDIFEELFKTQSQTAILLGLEPTDDVDALTANTMKSLSLISITISEITDQIPWKWWAKYQKINVEGLEAQIIRLFLLTIQLAVTFNMSADEVYEAYLSKNKVNHERQDSGYTKKDEDDCRHI